nr:MAG TPA: DNA polymerase II small subunit [Caudoviricetes sp.]
MDVITTYKRFENETDEELIYRICEDKDQIGSWQNVANIINELTSNDYGESTYRKKYQAFKKMLNANQSKFVDSDAQLKEIEIQKRELQKERNKLYATKTEYSRQIRQQSRFELFYENVANEISLYDVPNFRYIDTLNQKNEYILSIADIHAGANFVTETNDYSFEEITKRFEKLYTDVVNFVLDKNISNLKVLCMGDDIQGILRLSDLQLNESSVVKATVFVAKTIARFLNDLSKYCFIDYYHCPTSNHSQTRPLGTKASEIASEDVEYVICNYIKDVLVNNSRIIPHMNFGYEYIEIPIFDFKTIAMHGHTINNIDNVLKDFTYHKKTFYTTVFLAHYHAAKMGTVGEMSDTDCEVIVCPSFVGSCPYSEKLMKGAKPSCCIYGYDKKYGHVETYKFILN